MPLDKTALAKEILQTLTTEDLCLEPEIKLRMERLNYYEDYTGHLLREMDEQNKIKAKPFILYPQQTEPSRYYCRIGLQESEEKRILQQKKATYLKAIEIHSNRPYSADYLEAIVYLGLVNAKTLHPQVSMSIYRPHDYIDWVDGYAYRFDGFFTLQTGNYGIQVRNSLHMLFSTSTDLQTFLQAAKICRPVLINRLSSKELKTDLLRNRGRVMDIKKVVICTKNNPNYDEQPFLELKIDHIIQEIDHLLSIGDEELTGTDFFADRKYETYTFDELASAAQSNVPPVILEKTIGLIRLLHTTNLIDLAKTNIRHKGEAMLGAILTSASYNYLLASNKVITHLDNLYDYSRRRIRAPLSFYLQKLGDEEAKRILLENLRNLQTIGFLREPNRKEFQITDAVHPEEWLRY